MTALDGNRFQSLWRRLGGRDGSRAFNDLAAAYAEPHRAYHNSCHILDCLRHFDDVRTVAVEPDMIEMALWFHDAIYDPRAKDNEARSAAWAVQALTHDGVAEERARHIERLILLTRHDAEPDSTDGELLLDIDLSILGSERETFAKYDRDIRLEYAWVPEDEYHRGRRALLDAFLCRPRIYRTAAFERLETSARRNLANAIAALGNC